MWGVRDLCLTDFDCVKRSETSLVLFDASHPLTRMLRDPNCKGTTNLPIFDLGIAWSKSVYGTPKYEE